MQLSGGNFSGWALSGDSCPGGYCLEGNCLGGNYPKWELSGEIVRGQLPRGNSHVPFYLNFSLNTVNH